MSNSPHAIETDAYQDFSRITEESIREAFAHKDFRALTLIAVDAEAVPVDRLVESRVTLTLEHRQGRGSAAGMSYQLMHELVLVLLQAEREVLAYRRAPRGVGT